MMSKARKTVIAILMAAGIALGGAAAMTATAGPAHADTTCTGCTWLHG